LGHGKAFVDCSAVQGNFPFNGQKTTHLSSASKVFEDFKETFCKKFLWRGSGLRPLSAYFWFDRLLNGGERLDEVVLIYNGDGRFKVGDRVYAYTFGVTRLTPEDNRTNALFILKFF